MKQRAAPARRLSLEGAAAPPRRGTPPDIDHESAPLPQHGPTAGHTPLAARSVSSLAPNNKQEFVSTRRSSLLLDPPPSAATPPAVRARTTTGAKTWSSTAGREIVNPYSKRSRASLELLREHEMARTLRPEARQASQLRTSARRNPPPRSDSPVSLEDPAAFLGELGPSPSVSRRVPDDFSSIGGSGSGGARSTEMDNDFGKNDSSDASAYNKSLHTPASSSLRGSYHNLRGYTQGTEERSEDWADDFVRVPPKRKEWWAYLARPKTTSGNCPAHCSSQTQTNPTSARHSTAVSKHETPRFGEWRGSMGSKRTAPATRLRRSLARVGPAKSRTSTLNDNCASSNASGAISGLENGLSLPTRLASFTNESGDLSLDGSVGGLCAKLDVTPARYGRHWALDLFSLYHNVVREQLGQMTRILRRMSSAPSGPEPFLADFFYWLDHFQPVVNAILAAHERAIFPWIETVAQLEGRVSKPARQQAQTQMEEASVAISRCRDKLTHHSHDHFAFTSLTECLVALGSQLLDYFKLIETECPNAVEMFLTVEARDDVEVCAREVIMKNKDQAEILLPLVAIWLELHSQKLYQQWLNRVIPLSRRLQLRIWIRSAKSGFLKVGERLVAGTQYV